MSAGTDLVSWKRILRADEANLAFFAERFEAPGAAIFCAPDAPVPEFDVALIGNVDPLAADETLATIECFYRDRGRQPRLRLTPLSRPGDWPERLRATGFVETEEPLVYFSVPREARLSPRADVHVWRVASPTDGEQFAAIQVAGFGLPPAEVAREQKLTRRHLAVGDYVFYLAALEGKPVGAARSIRRGDGPCALAALTTVPEARGRGVATALLARMVADARDGGAETIFGTVAHGSAAAQRYRHLRFRRLFGTRTFSPAPG